MGTYTNAVKTHLEWEQHLARREAMKKRRVCRVKRQTTNPYRKVRLVHEKEKKEGVIYIWHNECEVENKTECWVYFDARYTDPNMRYDEETDRFWFHYSAPGLFKNVTNVRFVDSINSWMPEQQHPQITILWTEWEWGTKVTLWNAIIWLTPFD